MSSKITDTLETRQEIYDTPDKQFLDAMRIFRLIAPQTVLEQAIADQEQADLFEEKNQLFVAYFMIANKLSRLKNTPTHQDSWHDIEGYARCVQQCWESR